MPSPSHAPQRFSIQRKVLLGFGLMLGMFALVAFISWRSTSIFLLSAARVADAHEVLEIEEQVRRNLTEMESARRGFMATGEEGLLGDFEEAQRQITRLLRTLKAFTLDSPEQGLRLLRLQTLMERSLTLQNAEIEAFHGQGADAAVALFRNHARENVMASLNNLLTVFETEQRKTLAERAELTARVAAATQWAIAAGAALTAAALLTACGMILRDIKARRRAEQALAGEHHLLTSIIDSMPSHVFLKDAKGRFILDNEAHRRHLGLKPDETVAGRTVFDFYPAAAAAHFHDADRQVIENGRPIFNREEPAQPDSATTAKWLETTKVPLRDAEGNILGLVGISSDITARKTAEEQLVRSAAQLELSNAELANFASIASHDLQEPLRKIQAFGDRLRTKYACELGAQGQDYLARMLNAAERMQVLIQDLLKLSRITSRAQPFQPCDLRRIVAEVLSDLEVAIESAAATIDVGPLPTIDADPLQMRQLFQNLVSNALKFRKPGVPPVVQISSELRAGSEAPVAGVAFGTPLCDITIRDDGIGFDPKFADQIFVVFQRLHTRTEYEGTGIGLAVCRKICDRHGGQIVAQSADGQGATFTVTLPVHQPSTDTHEPKRSEADHDPDGR